MRDYNTGLEVPEPVLESRLKEEEYRPSNQQLLQEYEIRLQFLSLGCVIHVGCKSIAFETIESAMVELNEYVNNTYETQKKWRKILSS